MSIRTLEHLSDALANDLAWRKKELAALRFACKGTKQRDALNGLYRSSVAMLYAHWEGFIKNASAAYLEYVHFQRLRLAELAPNFAAVAARSILRAGAGSDRIAPHVKVAAFFLEQRESTPRIPTKNSIYTESNLSSTVLREILTTLGLNYSTFESKGVLIDEKLLRARNTVAHGEFVSVSGDAYDELYDEIIVMLDSIKTEIENAAVLGRYKKADLVAVEAPSVN